MESVTQTAVQQSGSGLPVGIIAIVLIVAIAFVAIKLTKKK